MPRNEDGYYADSVSHEYIPEDDADRFYPDDFDSADWDDDVPLDEDTTDEVMIDEFYGMEDQHLDVMYEE